MTDKKELVKHDDINKEIFFYFKSLFERRDQIDKMNHKTLLESIPLPSVTNDQKVVYDNDLTDKKIIWCFEGIPNNKFPGNDRLIKEFYETFWDELKDSFINSVKLAYQKEALSTSQRQAVIKLIEKKKSWQNTDEELEINFLT